MYRRVRGGLVPLLAISLALVASAETQPPPKAVGPAPARKAPKAPPPPVTSLDVTVTDPAGKPVEGAFVMALPTQGAYRPYGGIAPEKVRSTITGREGKAKLESLPPGPWNVTVYARGFVTQSLRRVASGPLAVRLEKGGSITGVVREGRGSRPVPDVRVSVGEARSRDRRLGGRSDPQRDHDRREGRLPHRRDRPGTGGARRARAGVRRGAGGSAGGRDGGALPLPGRDPRRDRAGRRGSSREGSGGVGRRRPALAHTAHRAHGCTGRVPDGGCPAGRVHGGRPRGRARPRDRRGRGRARGRGPRVDRALRRRVRHGPCRRSRGTATGGTPARGGRRRSRAAVFRERRDGRGREGRRHVHPRPPSGRHAGDRRLRAAARDAEGRGDDREARRRWTSATSRSRPASSSAAACATGRAAGSKEPR